MTFKNKAEVTSFLAKVEGVEFIRPIDENWFQVSVEVRMTRKSYETNLEPLIKEFEDQEFAAKVFIELRSIERWGVQQPSSSSGDGTYLYHLIVYKREPK